MGRFLGKLLGPYVKVGLPLMKNVVTQLAQSVLVPLGGLTAEASAADAGIHTHTKMLGSGASGSGTTTLIISNEKMTGIMIS